MKHLEDILKLDDLNPGSFGSLEKEVSYVTLLCAAVPVLFLPVFYSFMKKNILKATGLFIVAIALIAAIIYFRFSWIIHISQILKRYA